MKICDLEKLVHINDDPSKLIDDLFSDTPENAKQRGLLFEAIFNLAFITNSIPFDKFSKNYKVCEGKIDGNGILTPLINFSDYFKKSYINEGNKEGISDIKLINEEGLYALGSSKFSSNEYSIADFDLSTIKLKVDANIHVKDPIYYILCRDKNNISHGRQVETTSLVTECFDLQDLQKY